MIDVTSNYPDSIDPLIYCSDASISQRDLISQYEDYISRGRYDLAYSLVEENGIFGWYAHYLNLLENRIYSLQEYLDMNAQHRTDQCMYSATEPETFTDIFSTRRLLNNDVWITNTI